ncbi:MAG: hypothetical protein GX564_06835 [Oligosphaeraceae bacterium]|nr:hypothetical protein [Oligosphaeraceae bacterium]
MLEFGFAREDITPWYGIPLCGYFNPRPNRGVLDPLAIKAAVFRCGEDYAAIVSYDLCMLPREIVLRCSAEIKKAGFAFADQILFCATHTHTGPYMSACFSDNTNADYQSMVVEKTVSAIRRAVNALAPAELLVSKTECRTLAYNRRYWMKSGIVLTNPGKLNPDIDRPEGTVDTDIPLLAVRQNGIYQLLLANIVNHTDTIGGDFVSADWPGRLEHEVQSQLGYNVPVISMLGAQGNINHFNVETAANQTSYEEATRIGKAYAAVILAALYQLRSVKVEKISTASQTIEVPFMSVSEDEYEQAKAVAAKYKDAVMEAGRDFTSEDIAKKHPYVLKYFAERLMQCHDAVHPAKRFETMLALKFGQEFAVVSLPAEPFTEIGLAIKESSPFPLNFIAALGMGEVGYVGLPEHYTHGGGYETSPSSDKAGREVGVSFIKTGIALLNQQN